ncbi:uncharacterized protein LOC135078054 [Ostrinia nubilalis]|uniref:uncharacterized protein LOC135078054 n=1 Tax=Ostrinia nubilalis TaxID=29057 RepID=UPI0030825A7D
MGITWRFAMPLLSTLAALVIIVHSAEENLERDTRERRFDLRPRLLDMRPTDEQPWRVVRPEPITQQSAQGEVWHNDSQDEPPVRRKLGRKRKRRPPASLEEEPTEKELTLPPVEQEEVNNQDPETGRRRQKLRPNRWTEGAIDPDRPMRKRGQRRKRPSLGNWPRLSEFGDYHRDDKDRDIHTSDEADGQGHGYYSRKRIEDDYDEHVRTKIRHPVSDDYVPKERTKLRRPNSNSRYVISQETGNEEERPEKEKLVKEDKSLSEFSMELMGPLEPTEDDQSPDIDDKLREKSPRIFLNMDKAQEHGTIDPITLKEILKRSNGTSLSEILQQHNLTLADLLNGKENAISVLKSFEDNHSSTKDNNVDSIVNDNANSTELEISQREIINVNLNLDSDINVDKDYNITNQNTTNEEVEVTVFSEPTNNGNNEPIPLPVKNKYNVSFTAINKNTEQRSVALENRNSGSMIKRRFPPGIRRKLRMRPMANNTFKSQINRDLIALSARRYIHHNRRNATKSKEWRDMIPLIMTVNTTENQKKKEESNSLTTISIPEETTTIADLDETIETTIANEVSTRNHFDDSEDGGFNTEVPEPSTISIEILATEMDASITERPTTVRPISNAAGLRRQAFNNRLKKKRLKQRISTTEAPSNDIMKHLLELGDLVSSSEFIARTQIPRATVPNDSTETVTELEDFLTTETISKHTKTTKNPATREFTKSSGVTQTPLIFSTEETSKIEIEEILNDTRTSTKLSKILKERNMTLSELLQHRERGSSHVHLADIFHNASREPNPPEPFLSKSLLEPISKETYPLRAILEANAHEQATKPTTIDPIYTNHVNIPVIMDFGNNVNENAENMGIMSLFNNHTKETTLPNIEKSTLQQDSKGTPYKSTIIAVNATDDGDINRESRMLTDDQDMISWNEIFSMIRKNQKNETKALEKLTNELPPPPGTYKKIVLEEDVDGDGLIVLEDLQSLKSTEKKVATVSEEKIEFNSYEGADETSQEPGILKNAPSSAKSVTVATASIVGLAMILFLLTYAALKWKQQRSVSHKKTFGDERIPTPVFENRKVKKNCSSRSMSPMLPTSNIYTMNTLESQTGKDSPEYMWDTLRKPFQ